MNLCLSKLIDPQDGAFTPYDARSLADPSDLSERSDPGAVPESSPAYGPIFPSSSPHTPIRTRAISDALEKMLDVQARQISAIGQAWRAKYSLSPLNSPLGFENAHASKPQTASFEAPQFHLEDSSAPHLGSAVASPASSPRTDSRSWSVSAEQGGLSCSQLPEEKDKLGVAENSEESEETHNLDIDLNVKHPLKEANIMKMNTLLALPKWDARSTRLHPLRAEILAWLKVVSTEVSKEG